MNNFLIVVAAIGILAAGAAYGIAQYAVPPPSPGFETACRESMQVAAKWTIARAEERGKSVHFTQRLFVGSKIRSLCHCSSNKLKAEYSDNEQVAAGKLFGIRMRMALGRKAKDRTLRRQAREGLREELMAVMREHDLSLGDVGALSRKVDRISKSCFRT